MPSEAVAPERPTELTATQKALVDSFQAFVREEFKGANNGGSSAKKGKEVVELRPLQIIFLVALALDITLLYVIMLEIFPNIPDNRAVVFFLQKVLPALGGTLLVSYFKRLRAWLLEQSRNRRLSSTVLVLLVVLVLRWWPVYWLFVRIEPGLEVRVNGENPQFDDTHKFLSVGPLRPRDVVVQDGSNPEFPYHMSVGSVLEGTLARLPFADRIITQRRLAAAYLGTVYYVQGGGSLYISAEKDFVLNQPAPPANWELTPWASASFPKGACLPSDKCWHKEIPRSAIMDVFVLPQGEYIFTQEQGSLCWQKKQRISKKDELTLDSSAQVPCK